MRKKLLVLALTLALLALPNVGWGDSFSFQNPGLSPSQNIGTLTHWEWDPEKNELGVGMLDSVGGRAGGPFVGISLVGDKWKEHVNDPAWTKEDSVEPLKYIVRVNGGGKIDWYYTDPHAPGYKPWRNPAAGMLGQGSNGYVDYAPEVVYALKAQGFDPATIGGPSLKYMEQHVVSSRYDTVLKRTEIQKLWPADFTVADVANGIQPSQEPQDPLNTQAWFIIGKSNYFVVCDGWSGIPKYMDVAPYIDENNRTMVPIRFLAYALNIPENGVKWDEPTQTVTLTKGGATLTVKVGGNILTKNGQKITMDTTVQMRDDRTFLPARWIAEAFGAKVDWIPDEQKVLITM